MITYKCDKCGKELGSNPDYIYKSKIKYCWRCSDADGMKVLDKYYCKDCGNKMFCTGHYSMEPNENKVLTPDELWKDLATGVRSNLATEYTQVMKRLFLDEIMRADPYDLQIWLHDVASNALFGSPIDGKS